MAAVEEEPIGSRVRPTKVLPYFFYNFASDEKLQLSRIVFPLPYYTMEKKEHIEKDQWKHDPLFSRQDAYTVLFDKAEDMEMEKDTGRYQCQDRMDLLEEGKNTSGTIL